VDGEFAGEREGFNTMRYSEPEVVRVAHVAFKAARMRRRKVCSVDKANVLETSQLWRETMKRIGAEYPDVELSHLYIDNATAQLVHAPPRLT
jgi:3-isopropylmalate dehydrogenase